MREGFITKLDFPLLIMVSALVVVGLLAVYSATHTEGLQAGQYFNKQLAFSIIGLMIMITTAYLPFKFLQKTAYIFYGFSIFLLILVYFVGVRGSGAERWLAVGAFRIQPAEIAKLTTILAVARFVSRPEININKIEHFLILCGIILLPFTLIARQPDLGTSLVFLAMLIPLLLWSGLNWFALFVIVTPIITALLSFTFYAFLIWMFIVSTVIVLARPKIYIAVTVFLIHIMAGLFTPMVWDQLLPYQQQRLLTFANPEADPKGAGYQIIQSKVAIGSGGIWGKGFMQGSQTQLRFLPAQHTDFIFSVIGEEGGLFWVVIILLLYLMLLLYLIYLASNVRSPFASTATVGIVTVLLFHIFINIAMTVGLAPVTGLPLPFISYGGSFLIVMMLMIGYILNFSANRFSN